MRISLTILIGLWAFCGNAQTGTHKHLFDTVPFIMEHHRERLELFDKQPMQTGQIVFLGNSITEGGNWSELTGIEAVLNRGIGGDITFGLLHRIDEIIIREPSKLFLMIGINDIGKDIPPGVIAENISKLISRVKTESPQTEIIVQSILPVNPEVQGFPQHYDKTVQILITNQLIEKVTRESGVVWLNLYPYFLDSRQRLVQALTNDGLHLNHDGYKRWVQLLDASGHL